MTRAVRTAEASRSAFDDNSRRSTLYERHKFRANSGGRFDRAAPDLSGGPYGRGVYGSYAGQYDKLSRAGELDPGACL